MLSILLSFLSPSSGVSIKIDILSQKGLLAAIFKGLSEDPREFIESVLDIVARITALERLDMEIRCRTADDSWIEVIKLFELDKVETEEALDADAPASVSSATSANRYLLYVTSALAKPPSGSTSLTTHQRRCLGSLLGQLAISDSERQADLALHILTSAPELLPGFWTRFAPSLEPRLSSRWVTSVAFAGRIVGSPIPSNLQKALESSENPEWDSGSQITSISLLLDSALMPANLGKGWLSKALQLSQSSALVSFLACNFLYIGLRKSSYITETIQKIAENRKGRIGEYNEWMQVAHKMRQEIVERIPDLQVVIGLMQKGLGKVFSRANSIASTMESSDADAKDDETHEQDETLSISLVLRTLQLYRSNAPTAFSNLRFDFGRLLSSSFFSGTTQSPLIAPMVTLGQIALLELISVAPNLQVGEGSINWQWHKASEGHRSPLASIIAIYLSSSSHQVRSAAEQTAASLLSSSLLFEHEPKEAGIWLAALPREEALQSEALSFFDGCIQRCLQTPFKYVDQLRAIRDQKQDSAGLSFDYQQGSPLLATLLEQLLYRFGKQESAEPFALYYQRLMISLCSHSVHLQLAVGVATVASEAVRGISGQEEAKKLVIETETCIAIIQGKAAKMTVNSIASSPHNGDPFCTIFTFLNLKTEEGMSGVLFALESDSFHFDSKAALPLVRLCLHTLEETTEISDTIKVIDALLERCEVRDKASLLSLILGSTSLLEVFKRDMVEDGGASQGIQPHAPNIGCCLTL